MSSEGGHDFSHTAAEFPFRTFCGYCGTYRNNDEHTAEGREKRLRRAATYARNILERSIAGEHIEDTELGLAMRDLDEALQKPMTCKQILRRRKRAEDKHRKARRARE